MLAFAAPAAFAALGFLAVPIALHLWSRRTGRPQRIGSIAFFAAAPPPATRSPRIDDLWLLLLRCGVIAALAVAVAGPSWRSTGSSGHATWALVDSAAAADPRNTALLDSLRASGADVRLLGAGPIWSLLREADYEAPAGTRFVVVAPNRGAAGERPTIRSEVTWIVPPLRAASSPPLPPSLRSGQALSAIRRGGTTRQVLVYSDAGRRDDARYLTAALRAAAEVTKQPGVITQRDAGAVTPSDKADWIVWLADQPVPDVLLERVRRGSVLLTDALTDEPQHSASHVRLVAASDPDADPPLLRRRTAADTSSDDAPVWTDDAGRAVLALQREGAGRWLKFHARFHPSWSDLVLHPAFPEAVATLWAGDDVRTPAEVDRAVSVGQLLPARDATARAPAPATRIDLYHAFWLAGLLLFLLERLLTSRTREVEG